MGTTTHNDSPSPPSEPFVSPSSSSPLEPPSPGSNNSETDKGVMGGIQPPDTKITQPRKKFGNEVCHSCRKTFKIENEHHEHKLTCPYCNKRVNSVRILMRGTIKRLG